MSDVLQFPVERFEALVHGRDYPAAVDLLRTLLYNLDGSYGHNGPRDDARSAVRLAAAVAALFADPAFELDDEGFDSLVPYHRWLAAIFGATDLGNADHVLSLYVADGKLAPGCLSKFVLLYSLESELGVSLDALWKASPRRTAAMCLAWLSSRWCFTPRAHARREALLAWLPGKVHEIALDDVSFRLVQNAWMHASYALGPGKNDLKRGLNRLLRERLRPLDAYLVPPARPRPRMVVVLEAFQTGHVLHRVFSGLMKELARRFELCALAIGPALDAEASAIFDALHRPRDGKEGNTVRDYAEWIAAQRPDAVFYVSVGLTFEAICLANLRLAPIQIATYGHPSSTQSDVIDYFVMEEAYAGAAVTHSEAPVLVPDDSFPLTAPAAPAQGVHFPASVDIMVMATPMKYNAAFFGLCRRILDECRARHDVPVRLHVMVGLETGLARRYIERSVLAQLPEAVLHWQMDREGTLAALAACDLFLSPFPVGHLNSLVDCASQGLPGVCLEGLEIGDRTAALTMRKLGLPEWLIARDHDEYVAAAVRLAGDHDLRTALWSQLRMQFSRPAAEIGVCRGDAGPAAEAVLQTVLRGVPARIVERIAA